jgi:CRP/FNR family transcriptional regulator, cyclic AMP receptor protein
MVEPHEAGLRMLEQHPWLENESASFRAAIIGASHRLRAEAGRHLFQIGDEPGGIYGVVSGGILLSVQGRSGHLSPAHIVRSGTWFGHGPLMTRRRRLLGATAIEPSVLVQIPLTVLDRLVARDPALARPIGAISDYTQDVTISCVADLLIPDTERRIAAVLLRATGADKGIEPENPQGVPLTQSLLADLACTSRHSVHRALAAFGERGWLTWGYGHVLIKDVGELSQFANGL